jgi:AcrR family transcriptional regulator
MSTVEVSPKRRLRDARAAAYTELILESAERVFGREGYEATKVQAIAAEAGISLGTLYEVFAGKFEIWRSIHERHLGALFEATLAEANGVEEDDTLGRLLAGIGAYVRYLVSHPDYLRLHLIDGGAWGLGTGLRSRVQLDAWERGKTMTTELVARGIEHGLLVPEEPELLAQIMVGMHQVRLTHWVNGGRRASPSEVVAQVQEHTIRAFCRPGVVGRMLGKVPKKGTVR